MMKYICLFPLFLLSQSGFSFLSISQSAKGMGAGNSFLISAEETAQEFIPSLLEERENLLLSVSQFSWVSDISSKNVFVNTSVSKLAVALMLKYYEIGNIEERDKASFSANSNFTNYYAALGLSFAYPINEAISFGGSYKLLREKNYLYLASGSAFDLSFSYKSEDFIAFLSGNNLFSEMEKLSSQESKLPLIFASGFSYRHPFLDMGVEYHSIRDFDNELSVFAQKKVNSYLDLRAAYWIDHTVRSLSFGADFSYYFFKLSYSYTPHKYLSAYQLIQLSVAI